MDSKDHAWFYSVGGQSQGPVDFDELTRVVRRGQMDPDYDMAWNEGMSDWQTLSKIPELEEVLATMPARNRRRKPKPITTASVHAAPSLDTSQSQAGAPHVASSAVPPPPPAELTSHRDPVPRGDDDEDEGPRPVINMDDYGGIGRGAYMVSILLATVVFYGGIYFYQSADVQTATMHWSLLVVMVGVAVFVVAQLIERFRNIGMSGWWTLAHLFVPIITIWTGYRLIAAPTAYGDTKKLDLKGRVLAFLYFLPILLILFALAYLVFLYATGMVGDLPHTERIDRFLQEQGFEDIQWPGAGESESGDK